MISFIVFTSALLIGAAVKDRVIDWIEKNAGGGLGAGGGTGAMVRDMMERFGLGGAGGRRTRGGGIGNGWDVSFHPLSSR